MAARRAWVQGDALLGSLDRVTQEHGLAATAGNVSHTGVGGLTLGGGMGWLARQLGLSCDNVAAFELVTAEGNRIHASETEHPDLFWGLRGGGGNFGIVTEFEFQLHPVGTRALVADYYFPVQDAFPVLQRWRDLNARAPRQATFTAWVGESDASLLPEELRGMPMASVGFVWVGDPDDARRLLRSMHALGPAVAHRVQRLSYLQLQAYGGAIADVPDADTAFSHRDTLFEFVAAARWSDPAEDQLRIAAARRCATPLDRFASGAYVNTLADEGSAGLRRVYPPDKLARLTALKDIYDPDNVFHLNQNIRPRPGPSVM